DRPSLDFYQEGLLRESLHEVLDSLPAIYREVLTLHYLGGMSTFEIAQFLGTSPATIRQRLSRARAKLKEEMIAMMNTTFQQHKLQPSFTFRIVEMVKQIKIQPAPHAPWLPFGLSAATGIVFAVLMFSAHLISLTPFGTLFGSPMPGETKVMEEGELPVDILEISEISFLSSEQGNGKDSAPKRPNPQNAFAPLLAPSGGEGKWTKRADMPKARYCYTSAVNGKIYAIGGSPDNNAVLSTVEEYDPAADKWTRKADMPTARALLSTIAVNGKIYAIGGGVVIGIGIFSTVEEYDPVADKWTKKTNMPTARCLFCTSEVDGKIYAIGGWNGNNMISTVEEYDPVADKWTKKADMPTARIEFSTSAVNGRIYAIGGGGGGVFSSTVVEEYNPVADKWTKKADMPTARRCLSTSVVDGRIYAIGGSDINIVLSTVEEYDPVADKWTKKSDMPTARGLTFPSTSAVNGKIYAIGGFVLQGGGLVALSTVEEYTPEGSAVSWQDKLPTTWGRLKRGN
ncbi:sigma-70 family RNA polymerase sigma factor, partial [Candidatus Poribacteria bacterium]|nr:sigma-70 family RNA polymerase sigma factor [Candidatus Poribacteria bacterium]